MPVIDLFAKIRPRLSARQALVGCALLGAVVLASGQAFGQAAAPSSKTSGPAKVAKASGTPWHELTTAQKQILRPLAGTWDTLSSAHKSKWIALAQNYPSRAPAEQEKMQSRMVEWATLTPSQRESARLNFAETKKVSPSERAAEWETYQSLSTEEKNSLAANSKAKPTGAAVAVKPVPPNKLTAVPITRHTPHDAASASTIKPRINPNTLLPLPSLPAVVVPPPAPAPEVAPSTSAPAVNP